MKRDLKKNCPNMLYSMRNVEEDKDRKKKDVSISKLEYQGLLTHQG